MKRDHVESEFAQLDLHDDGLISVELVAPRTKTNTSTIRLKLQDDATGAVKTLSFNGCGNLRFRMDLDVLAQNWFAQTERASCEKDVSRLTRFVRAQKPHWHATYMPPFNADHPILKKISSIRRYRLFRVTFFGGTIEVLATCFELKLSEGPRKRSKG